MRCVSAVARKKEDGFTLVELSIILVIAGMILVAAVAAYNLYVNSQRQTATNANNAAVSDAVKEFYYFMGRYPCPAAPKANDGFEKCGLSGLAFGTCDPSTGICRGAGRDADGEGGPDGVLIGAVPYNTINPVIAQGYSPISIAQIRDGWSRKIMYGVSEKLTDGTTYNANMGAIYINDENGTNVMDGANPGSAHYVVFSAGDDGAGAYSQNGVLFAPCPATGLEKENCNSDGTFTAGLRTMAVGPNYYDDLLTFSTVTASALWTMAPVDQGAATNTNAGNVGIGTTTPNFPLDVAGNFQSNMIYTKKLCDYLGNDCYDPDLIGSDTGMGCGPNMAVVSIGRVNSDATDPTMQCSKVITSEINALCNTGEYLVGLSVVNGVANAICQPLP
jgi:type II secretory pathway pseudopilin PulG